MKRDIENRKDIEMVIDTFYSKVRKDDALGYLFNDVANVNWEMHLPVMYNFWENVLFYTGNYRGNPMEKHFSLHQKSPLSAALFERWIELFLLTTDELYEGPKAQLLKERAKSIAGIMQIKILS